ncbi:hypothetical protein [Streptomyces sp. NPDC058240]|uniref:hypothetical protein n=1 Tax=Streptomyces sp. NPDC058240 TaxID=3346396 RepID=UPI0036E09FA7
MTSGSAAHRAAHPGMFSMVSRAFTAACETLGISAQVAPPFTPTAEGIVERDFGSINSLFCQHLPGHTGSDVARRGRDIERETCYTVAQLQDLLDEWLAHWHHRPHEGLRHPVLPRAALTPNPMWAALAAVAGYVTVALTGSDYLELLPVRWQAITERGILLHHRTYDHDLLGPCRGQDSDVAARGRKWEVRTIVAFDNPIPTSELDQYLKEFEELVMGSGLVESFAARHHIRAQGDDHAPVAIASAILQLRLADLDALNATFTMPGAVDLIKRWQGRYPYKAIWVNHDPLA